MALATQCPHCGKRFRVAADQLKLRGGIVRCGACHEIFDGNATLIDLDALAAKQAAGAQAPAVEHPDLPAAASEVVNTVVPAAVTNVVPAEAGTTDDRRSPHTDSEQPAPAISTAPEPSSETVTAPIESPPEPDREPIYTLDFDHTFDPFGILPKPAAPDEAAPAPVIDTAAADDTQPFADPAAEPDEPIAQDELPAQPHPAFDESEPEAPPPEHAYRAPDTPAPSYADARRIEPTFDLPVDEELVAAALPEHHDFDPLESTSQPSALHGASAPLPMRESAPGDPLSTQPRPPLRAKAGESKANRRSKLTPTKIAPPKLRVPEIDEPEFVKRSRQQEQSGKTVRLTLAVGSVLLLLVLAGQSALTFRNVLAARYPAAKPALVSACAVFGCKVELPARIDNLTIEQGELAAMGSNTYSLATLLHNQASLVQAWPHIELTLMDANDKPLVRRVFTPAEYLPQGSAPATGFAARAEQPVKLYFQLDQLKPSGYRIAIFYP
jgi:predicted Zn finger-like uncharacterized protein